MTDIELFVLVVFALRLIMKNMLSLAVFCVFVAAGCARSTMVTTGEEGSPCIDDEDCPSGSKCVENVCAAAASCSDDDDCPSHQTCNNGNCIGNSGCQSSADCPDDQYCVNNVCTRMGTCVDDSECPPEASCEEGTCRLNGQCQEDADCPADQTCSEDGICIRNTTCVDDSDCPIEQSCVDGVCSRNGICVGDGDCPEDQNCGPDGLCIRNNTCGEDLDCPIDQSCEQGVCIRNGDCVDNSDCPGDQACLHGRCVRHAGCREDGDCDNNAYCDGAESCDILTGCQNGVAPTLDDGIDCTDDRCDDNLDQVLHVPIHARCDDGELCTDDVCSPTADCQNPANNTAQPQQVEGDCRIAFCQGGVVQYTPNNNDLPPDDQIPCTTHTCVGGFLQVDYNHARCDQGSPCKIYTCTPSGCDETADNSLVPPQMEQGDCKKQICVGGVVDTVSDVSDEPAQIQVGDCKRQTCNGSTPETVPDVNDVPQNQRTDDCYEQVCTVGGQIQLRVNTSETPPQDHIACTVETCHINGGVTHTLDHGYCNDNLFCNGIEVCDPVLNCQPGTPPDINDGIDCTQDACDEVNHVTHTPSPTYCDNNQFCDGQEYCDPALGCQPGTPPVLNDGVSCTDDSCDENSDQVVHAINGSCDNNLFCDGVEYCDPILDCQPGTPPTLSDNIDCTEDSCDEALDQVVHVERDDWCHDNNSCTLNRCSATLDCQFPDINGDGDPVPLCGADGNPGGGDDDCQDGNSSVYPGATELNNGEDDDCDGYYDEGFVTLNCAGLNRTPSDPDVFELVDISVPVTDPVAGATAQRSYEWTVETEPAANSLALHGTYTPSVDFRPVLYGDYTLRLTMSQPDSADQHCEASFNIPYPPVELNAMLIMEDAADVDLHVLGPDGSANHWGFWWDNQVSRQFWYWMGCNDDYAPFFACDGLTDGDGSDQHDCHWGTCNSCAVTVPNQPACEAPAVSPDWYPWGAVRGTEDPLLEVDNQLGCYLDGDGNTVCTPESISVTEPYRPFGTERYTVAVHYYGAPPTYAAGNWTVHPGVSLPGAEVIDVKVRLYCQGQAPVEYSCTNMTPDGWCFVADVVWGSAGCQGFTAATRNLQFPW